MRIIKEIWEMQTISKQLRQSKKTIGFVPTMGALHPGHMSLIKKARRDCNTVIVSIFVNPLQFGPGEDYEQYPKDMERDCSLAREEGVDLVFAPDHHSFYPQGYSTHVEVGDLGDALCGEARPGHFRGVTTVVAKLFNVVRPNVAYFGQKDYQQSLIIRKMVDELAMDIEIEVLPIVRRRDGLALSSRNAYLDKEQIRTARLLYQSLKKAQELILNGEREISSILSQSREVLEPMVQIDYLSICDYHTLQPLTQLDSGKVLIALAGFVGKTRLIDNILVDIPK